MALSRSTPVVLPVFWTAFFVSSLGSGKEWVPTIISEYDNATCTLRMRIAPSLDRAFRYDVTAVRTDDQEEYEASCLNVRGKLEVHCEITGIPTDTPREYETTVQARDGYGKAISPIHHNATRIYIPNAFGTPTTVPSDSRTSWVTRTTHSGSHSRPQSETISTGNNLLPKQENLASLVETGPSWRLILIILFAVVTLFVLAALSIVCIKKSMRHRQMDCWHASNQSRKQQNEDRALQCGNQLLKGGN